MKETTTALHAHHPTRDTQQLELDIKTPESIPMKLLAEVNQMMRLKITTGLLATKVASEIKEEEVFQLSLVMLVRLQALKNASRKLKPED